MKLTTNLIPNLQIIWLVGLLGSNNWSIFNFRRQSSISRSSFGQFWSRTSWPPSARMARVPSCSARTPSTTMALSRYVTSTSGWKSFSISPGSGNWEVCEVLQGDLPPQLLVLRQLRHVRDSQLCVALRAIPDDRQLPQQEVQMVKMEEKKLWIKMLIFFPGTVGRRLNITTITPRRKEEAQRWDWSNCLHWHIDRQYNNHGKHSHSPHVLTRFTHLEVHTFYSSHLKCLSSSETRCAAFSRQ